MGTSCEENFDLECRQCKAAGYVVWSMADNPYPSAYSGDSWGFEISVGFECVPYSGSDPFLDYQLVCGFCGADVRRTRTREPIPHSSEMRTVASSGMRGSRITISDFKERQEIRSGRCPRLRAGATPCLVDRARLEICNASLPTAH